MTAAEASTRALPRASHRRPFSRGRTVSGALIAVPVVAVLAMQAFASIRLLYATGASSDEALYIYSGHQLVHEMWHGGGSPYYENYFSGAPVIYPVLAAMLDHAGGLVLVRAVSSVFMLIATGLLFATTRRLFGYWPAVVAAGLYAALGITQGLGAYATFDALALMLMAFAAYCAAKSAGTAKWLVLIPGILLLANATKYASILFDPVIIMLAALTLRAEGWRRVWHRAAILAGVTFFLLAIATVLAGTAYFHGILFTTIARKTGTGVLNLNPATSFEIVMFSWHLIGLIMVIAIVAMVVALAVPSERSSVSLLSLFLIAGVLVTLEALRLHDLTSVSKHDDFGVWFTAMAAGYALARGAELSRNRNIRAGWVILALLSVPAAFHFYGNHGPIIRPASVNDASRIVPYLQSEFFGSVPYRLADWSSRSCTTTTLSIPWWRVTTDNYVKYPIPVAAVTPAVPRLGRVCDARPWVHLPPRS